jgi:hypothetical protein
MDGACIISKLFESFYYCISAIFKNNMTRSKSLTQMFVYNPKVTQFYLDPV